MFFKKLSFVRRHAAPQMNDDMNASIFTRTDHTVQLGQKAFNMSQPTLGMHISPSVIISSEDRSDISHTNSGSPTSSSQIHQRRIDFTSKTYLNGVYPTTTAVSEAHTNSHWPLSSGLPSIPEPPAKAVSGLPMARDQLVSSTLTLDNVAAQGATHNSNPYLQQSHSVQSVPATVSDSASTVFQDAPCCMNGDCEHCKETTKAGSDAQVTTGSSAELLSALTERRGQIPPVSQPLETRQTQSLPSRRLQAPSLAPSTSQSSSIDSPESMVASPAMTGESTPRALHPRLASLPPPMMTRFTTQGSARFTPSIVSRPPPMPLLNLPTLPLPTPPPQSSSTAQSSHTRLRSMPALPHCGPGEMDDPAADHENAGLDEMEDLDEEDEDSEIINDDASEDEPSPTSLEIEVPVDMTPRLRAPLPPSISRSRRGSQQLPTIIATSPFALDFEAELSSVRHAAPGSPTIGNRGTVYFTPVEPTAGPSNFHTQTPRLPTIERTPASPMDYFNVKTHEWQPHPAEQGRSGAQKDPSRTPRPIDYNDFVAPRTVPMPNSSPRPMLTHHGSKSMSDLLAMGGWKDKDKETGEATTRVANAPDYKLATTRDTPEDNAGSSTVLAASREPASTIRRRRSLPMFTNATDPPPYPDFSPLKKSLIIVPREEEGKEKLPPYTNQIYLAAIMPRKLEFDAPGMQSRDRKWKRALCVLEGTAFKVYKVHASVVGDWWERAVGVGDKTSVDPGSLGTAGAIRVSAIRESERHAAESTGEAGERTPKIDLTRPVPEESNSGDSSANASAIPHSRSKLSLAASLLHPKRHRDRSVDRLGGSTQPSRSRLSIDIPHEENSRSGFSTPAARRSMDSGRPSSRMTSSSELSSSRSINGNIRNSSSLAPTSTSSNSSPSSPLPPATSHFSHLSQHTIVLDQQPDPKDLVRQYSMQNAESGLASDYLKRKNVIRVRMEGEQFLLQARDVPAVIDWIEGIQAATNIALDLDERPMPKGPIFPRRRRRRPRRPAENANQGGASNTNEASSTPPARPS
ncbi:hypothetical protein BDY19DRAFT_955503 [Irpex rosettiformis]|uniref:Uncharacterized protein n=1 Tax=Irpex rosettiformis TaxID=378272 RepID=A0ACB8U048_9APHY|nr:hypothetical protein BDY19DRAFT_955503 [Irpex rosettiformis]